MFFLSCSCWQAKSEAPAAATPFAPEELKSDVPFSTKEPKNFQAEIVVVSNNQETKTFMARDGDNRRYDYVYGAKNQTTVLEIGASKSFLLVPTKKIYAENVVSTDSAAQAPENFKDSLTNEWLNAKADAKFTNLGAENGLTKYRVVFGENENAESIVYIDEKIGLPVRQEFYSGAGEQKTLTFAVEIRDFKLQADDHLFEIPKDFRKVSLANLRAAMREIKFDGQ
ncbi:MAG: hypothetical protein M3033_10990 [Acidobacteriota bacterium]|nr:hypothetical protein [Acidobacteriota bacterium]